MGVFVAKQTPASLTVAEDREGKGEGEGPQEPS